MEYSDDASYANQTVEQAQANLERSKKRSFWESVSSDVWYECICLSIDESESKINENLSKPTFLMRLESNSIDLGLIKFLQVKQNNDGTYNPNAIKPDSDGAKLCRLTLGDIKKRYYSEALGLLRRLVGKRFMVTLSKTMGKGGDLYINKIRPVDRKRVTAPPMNKVRPAASCIF